MSRFNDDIVPETDDDIGGGIVIPDGGRITPNQDRILKIGRTLDTISSYVREIESLEYEYDMIRRQYQKTSYLDRPKLQEIQKKILQYTRWIKENKTTLDHLSFMLDEEPGDKDAVLSSIHNRARIKSNDNIIATAEEDVQMESIGIQNVGTRNWVGKSLQVVISIPDYRGVEDEELVSDPISPVNLDIGDSIEIKDITLKRKDELSLLNKGFYDAKLFIRDSVVGDLSIKKSITIQII